MFTTRNNWSFEVAFRMYHNLAAGMSDNTLARYNWGRGKEGDFTSEEVTNIYEGVVAKIPVGVQRVLDLGCGDARFAQVLKTLRPEVAYRGVDFIPSNVEAGQAQEPSAEFVLSTAEEYLAGAPMDWDFVISIHCAFSCTTKKDAPVLFNLLNAKAPKGFLLLVDPSQVERLTPSFNAAVTTSTSVSEQYVSGDRGFLPSVMLKEVLAPVLLVRSGTSAEVPVLPDHMAPMRTGVFNHTLSEQLVKAAKSSGQPVPTTFPGVTITEGVASSEDVEVSPELVARISPRLRSPRFQPPAD